MTEKIDSGELAALLRRGVDQLGINLVDEQIDRLIELVGLLIKWNRAYNLTAIRDPREIVIKHLLDSLSIESFIDDARIIDVGTGGGFPGLPLAIARPSAQFVLLDASAKKVRFVQRASDTLELENVAAVHGRVEDYVEQKFDIVVCRAFASLEDIVALTGHLLASGGRILAMKGQTTQHSDAPVLNAAWRAEEQPVVVPLLTGARHLVQVTRIGNLESIQPQD
ncbi:MAG: 16S rRNA (guanine(527)-N(7))-methyltransferase RsmG [Pseudomonadota bacterium]